MNPFRLKSHRLFLGLAAPALLTLAACGDGDTPTAPDLSGTSSTVTEPSFAGGGGKPVRYSARAYGTVHAMNGAAPQLSYAQGVLSVSRPGPGTYCLELDPGLFPDPSAVVVIATPFNSTGLVNAIWYGLGQNWCPPGHSPIGVFTLEFEPTNLVSFNFIIM